MLGSDFAPDVEEEKEQESSAVLVVILVAISASTWVEMMGLGT